MKRDESWKKRKPRLQNLLYFACIVITQTKSDTFEASDTSFIVPDELIES